MSKASEWAKCQVKELNLRQMGSPCTVNVFLTTDEGAPGMRIDNLGPFNAKGSRKLARWILDTFGEQP